MSLSEKRIVTLTLTNACNLSCVYCYEANKSSKFMTFEIAKKIIDYEFSLNDPTDIEFDMFGGEPFLHFDLIKQIDKYLVENYAHRRWIIFATTNGTLVHSEVQKWLRERPYFYCGLSLDGNKMMHDLNRTNSYDAIDLDFFKKQYPNQGVKMTVSYLTLPYLAQGVIYLHNLGFYVDCNLAYGIDWSSESNESILERELMKLIEFYLNNPEYKPCKMLDFNISSIAACEEKMPLKIRKWCGAGTKMHTYDVDGVSYPCQFFMPLSVGSDKAIKSKELNFLEEIPIENLDSKCHNCPYILACPTCYGSNYCSNDSIYKKEDNYCKLTKIQIEACSYFKAKQWERKQLNLSQNEEILLLRSIKAIQDIIRSKKENK